MRLLKNFLSLSVYFLFALISVDISLAFAQEVPGTRPQFAIGGSGPEYGTMGSATAACQAQATLYPERLRVSSPAAVIKDGPRMWVSSYIAGRVNNDAPEEVPYNVGNLSGYLCHAQYVIYFPSPAPGRTETVVDKWIWIYPVCPDYPLTGSYNYSSPTPDAYCISQPKCPPNTPPEMCPRTQYPFHMSTGQKRLKEVDYVGGRMNRLNFVRTYQTLNDDGAEGRWHFSSHKYLQFEEPNKFIRVWHGDGSSTPFTLNGNSWVGPKNGRSRLYKGGVSDTFGYLYITEDDIQEFYDQGGLLLKAQWRDGYTQTMTYTDEDGNPSPHGAPTCQFGAAIKGTLRCIIDSDGKQLAFSYGEELTKLADPLLIMTNKLSIFTKGYWLGERAIVQMIDPAGNVFNYAYDGQDRGAMVSATYPGGAKRTYLYDESGLNKAQKCRALTGIYEQPNAGTDVRFISYSYEFLCKAYKSVLAGGVGANEVYRYAGNGDRIQYYDPLNKVQSYATSRVFDFAIVNKMPMVTRVTSPVADGTPAAEMLATYDTNGNLASFTDRKGIRTTYDYDLSRNLEIRRTEAVGTAQARTTTTTWHPTLRLPGKIYEPSKVTHHEYDSLGNLLFKMEKATDDSDGSRGINATEIGTGRVWTYTYNNFGQVLTAKGPRTDINDLTSYVYDNQGNLTSVTNPAGHVTSMGNYDAHGRVGLITDPNGVTTALTYHPRGWLLSRAVTADGVTETTSYTYDGVGQMTQVTLPDNSVITYTYDDAHRLTKVSDHLGNSITYTLDNMGNRIKEEVKDTSGTLTQQVTRVYDILNRLKEVTGGMQ